MSIQGIMNTAMSGIQVQTSRLGVAANNIANSSTPGYNRIDAQGVSVASGGVHTSVSSTGSGVDLASELLDVMSAEIAFKANAVVFETGADLWEMLKTIKRD